MSDNPLIEVIQSGFPTFFDQVEVYEKTYDKIAQKHSIESGAYVWEQVKQTIGGQVSRICQSQSASGNPAFCLVNDKTTSGSGDPLRVTVKLTENVGVAILTTAHFQGSNPRGPLLLETSGDD